MENKENNRPEITGVMHGPYKPDDVATEIGQFVGLKEFQAYEQLQEHVKAVESAEEEGFIDPAESEARKQEIETEQHKVLDEPYYPEYVQAVLASADEHDGDTLGFEYYKDQAEIEKKRLENVPTNLTFDFLKNRSPEVMEKLSESEKFALRFIDWFEQQYKRAGIIGEDASLTNPEFLDNDGNETLNPRTIELINQTQTVDAFSLLRPSQIELQYGLDGPDDPDAKTNLEMVYMATISNAISNLSVELNLYYDKLPSIDGAEECFISAYRLYAGDGNRSRYGYHVTSKKPTRHEDTFVKVISNTFDDFVMQMDSGDFTYNPPDSAI